MKRQIIYPGQIPLETDLLATNKNTMIALAKLTAAIIGTATMVNGLTCAPNVPAALSVVVSPGEIYSLQNIDGTAYSSIAADTTHSIMKQGISMDAVTLTFPAPAMAGQSINYLIQAAFSEVDSGAVVLPYYNASNPSTAYSGPAGAGTTNNTVRDGVVVLSAKAGIATLTGSQVTPVADAGYVGLWVVTVANGQTAITAGNITQAAGAPFSGTAAMLNALNAFTVSPTAPTPAQFDSSTKMATMAAVQRAQGSYNGYVVVDGSRALAVNDIGKILYMFAGTLTLPSPSSLGIPIGAAFDVFGYSGNSASTKIIPAAGVVINQGEPISQLVILKGQAARLFAATSSGWQVTLSTANLSQNAELANYFANKAVTPPQFDNSDRIATTAALQRGLGNLRGVRVIAASTTLTVDDVGMLIEVGGSAALTLGLPTPVGISGSTINLQLGTSAKVTLSTPAGLIFINGTYAAAFPIQGAGTSLALVSDGSNWTQYGNTGSSSLAPNGYQTSAGGVLEQWGVVTLGAPGTSTVWTFPTAFPSVAPYGVWACNSSSGGTPYYTSSNAVPGLSTASFTSNAPAGTIAYVRVIGKSS